MAEIPNGPNGWIEYRKLVLSGLEKLNDAYIKIQEEQIKIREEVAMLKVKSGVWGLIGGAIPVAIGLIIWLIERGAG